MPPKRIVTAPNESDSRHAAPTAPVKGERVAKTTTPPPARAPRTPSPRRQPLNPPPSAPKEVRKPMVFEDEARGPNDFDHLGVLLVYLRNTYAERTRTSAHTPKFTITALAVANELASSNYPMTSGSYSLLEQGVTLPKNPEQFFAAIGNALAVKESSKYWMLLRYQYLFDHARRMVGDEFAIAHFPRGQHALDLLRVGAL